MGDVVLDMKEGCGEHGRIRDACVVKKDMADPAKTLKAGDVFILCYSMEDATKIMRAMGHRKYDGRPITMKSWEDDKWNSVIKPSLVWNSVISWVDWACSSPNRCAPHIRRESK